MEKRGFCQLLLITAILVGSATLFFAIGALGEPKYSRVSKLTCTIGSNFIIRAAPRLRHIWARDYGHI